MNAMVNIEAGICGFRTTGRVTSADDQQVGFDVETDCEKIATLGRALKDKGAIDAYEEIGGRSVLLETARETLTGCCAGCAVPVGLFKAMQVAAGLALPKDIGIRLSKE